MHHNPPLTYEEKEIKENKQKRNISSIKVDNTIYRDINSFFKAEPKNNEIRVTNILNNKDELLKLCDDNQSMKNIIKHLYEQNQ